MKILCTQEGKEAVYVQLGDIAFLTSKIDTPIPASIFLEAYKGPCTIIDNTNRFTFLRFDQLAEVEFFKSLDFIIDYSDYKDFNKKQLKEKLKSVAKEINQIEVKYNKMSFEEKLKNANLPNEHVALCQIFQEINNLYLLKKGKIKVIFPF